MSYCRRYDLVQNVQAHVDAAADAGFSMRRFRLHESGRFCPWGLYRQIPDRQPDRTPACAVPALPVCFL
ncbi:hypothetical protein D3C81_2269390 [compost metagenome]